MNRGRAMCLALVTFLTAAISGQPATGQEKYGAKTPRSEIVLCGGLVTEAIMQANASFQVSYQLRTGPSGEVRDVKKIRNEILPDQQLLGCLSRWVLPVPDAIVDVSLAWKHGAGWAQVVIAMPGNQVRRITLDPGWP